MKKKILIVDDEKPLRDTLARWFRPQYECLTAPDADDALRQIRENSDLALMITDVKMPGEDGVTLLRKAKEIRPNLPAILLTAYGSVDLAVQAMKEGARDFFQKPVTDLKAFELRVAQAISQSAAAEPVPTQDGTVGRLTGSAPALTKVYGIIRKAAPTDATVLIEGPSGSGKELAARAVHDLSKRAAKPFVAVECSAFSSDLLKSELFGYEPGTFTGGLKDGKKGCIEEADGGTLFLDEIGEIDLPTQIALLRTLETKCVRRLGSSFEKAVDFRLVAATNKNLLSLVAEGKFREDLFYRLNVIDIRMPALKDHPSDIAPLVEKFIAEFSAEGKGSAKSISPDALGILEKYDWPGNVRQLKNAIEKMMVLSSGDTLTIEDVPSEIASNKVTSFSQASTLADVEKAQILAALEAAGNNRTTAAASLGISRRTLHRKLKEWSIK
ncbi:MAG: sigma-54-dependent Fis family transcriptional regulator [Kiritimatiellae bacterium]|nr:sigma-54-dependent Fis family transcriptional regulator [Kiritimatiellia bacterium]